MDSALTIHQLVENQAEQWPGHIAILDAHSSYDYNSLNRKANQIAHHLLSFAPVPDNLIAIAVEPSPQLIIGIVAILKAGCGYLPLDAKQPADRLQYILEDTKAPILITQSHLKERFSGYSGHIILIDQIWNELTQPESNPNCPVKPENLAYTIYTSGSTGKPKGVLIEHKSVVNYIKWFNEYSRCQPQDRIDFSSSIIFDMAVTTTITALASGLQVVICPDEIKKNITQYLFHLKKNKINIIKLTPSYFKVLIQEAKNKPVALPDLTSIILGGEVLFTKECTLWLGLYPKHALYNEYGPTEATVAVSQYKVTKENLPSLGMIVPIGKPGENVHCIVLNDNGQPVIPGELGELHIGGICLARGYLNQPELTAKQFIHEAQERLYKTGDLCRCLPDGNIELIKRVDDQVKIRGYRIEPAEIAACLTSHPLVQESIVIARENPWGDTQLIAYYIPQNKEKAPGKNELRAYLQGKLADYMIPTSLIMLQEFPLNENGKLDKKALPEPVFNNEIVMPQTRIERQLIDIWRKEFHLQNIGTKSNFFELGGHSLTAIRIMSEIEKNLGKKIELKDLYNAPTIGELAKIIKTASNSHHEIEPEMASYKNINRIPLGDFQFTFWVSNLFEPKIRKLNIIARRRVAGKLDIQALTLALEWVFKKHEILTCEIGERIPALYLNKEIKYRINENDLTNCGDTETEEKLSASMDELINKTLWQKNRPLIAVRLFALKNNMSELQISVSHMSFDDASEEILFSDLSAAYLHFKNDFEFPTLMNHAQYKDYIFYERNHLNKNLERDIKFWEEYFHDTTLVTLPEKEVLHDMQNIPYSTYLDIPTEIIEDAHQICTIASVSFTDLFCAAITLVLKNSIEKNNDNIFINIIRSIRDNEIHDNMIGCFLRLDPIKVKLDTHLNLIELAKSIQQSRIDTEPYQACSGMVKAACLDKSYRKKPVQNFLIRWLTKIYCKLFSNLDLNEKMLAMYGRLNSLRTKQQFLININLLNNFISPKGDSTLFGHRLEEIKNHEYDLAKFDNVLDICVFRNKSMDQVYLAISGNLQPAFRQSLGEKIIEMIKIK